MIHITDFSIFKHTIRDTMYLYGAVQPATLCASEQFGQPQRESQGSLNSPSVLCREKKVLLTVERR
jgi:hypothetical protein